MLDVISRQDLLESLEALRERLYSHPRTLGAMTVDDAINAVKYGCIETAPSIRNGGIIHCNNCRYGKSIVPEKNCYLCSHDKRNSVYVEGNHYCSYAVRRRV